MCFAAAVNAVAAVGRGFGCNALPGAISPVLASSIHIRNNDFALDSRQEPYEVILHVRIRAGAVGNGGSYRDA